MSSPDHSGVRLKVTPEEQERKAGVMLLGHMGSIREHDISQSGEMKRKKRCHLRPGPQRACHIPAIVVHQRLTSPFQGQFLLLIQNLVRSDCCDCSISSAYLDMLCPVHIGSVQVHPFAFRTHAHQLGRWTSSFLSQQNKKNHDRKMMCKVCNLNYLWFFGGKSDFFKTLNCPQFNKICEICQNCKKMQRPMLCM